MSSIRNTLSSRLSNLTSILGIVIRRLNHHRGISLSSAVGIISVLSLIICIPIFTSAVLSQVLMKTLADKSVANHRSLFSIHAYYLDDSVYFPLSVQGAETVSQFINTQVTSGMGLKVKDLYTTMETQPFSWAPVKYQSSKARQV